MVDDQISDTLAIVDDGAADAPVVDVGDARAILVVDDGADDAPIIDIGADEVECEDDIPLGLDRKRDLKAEAVSMEHMLAHTPFNLHWPVHSR